MWMENRSIHGIGRILDLRRFPDLVALHDRRNAARTAERVHPRGPAIVAYRTASV